MRSHDGIWGRSGSTGREARDGVPWKRWGPYLSERQWGTVREDYSDNGDAWSYFSHDQARSRAYKWGEDGIAGFCDDHQRLCFGIALWNGVDPILKERMFGLTNAEGNHGEDVKEYYFYLDATPTSSYLKYRYRYPLAEFPYDDLVATNRARGRLEMEYELIDTGVFDDDRYVDVDVEYAKAAPDDIHVRITVANRSAEPATRPPPADAVVPQHVVDGAARRACCERDADADGGHPRRATPSSATLALRCEGDPTLLFTENETNTERLWGSANASPYVKDAFHEYVVGRSARARSTRRAPAPRRPRTTCSRSRREAPRWCTFNSPRPGRGNDPAARRSMRSSPGGSPRRTSSTPRSRRRSTVMCSACVRPVKREPGSGTLCSCRPFKALTRSSATP